MKKTGLILFLVAMTASCTRTNPFFTEWDTPYGLPPFSEIKTGDYMPAIREGIRQQNEEIAAILACEEEPTFENVIAPLDASGALLGKVAGVLFNLSESDGTPELLAVEEEATPLFAAQDDEVYMNKALYEKVAAVWEQGRVGLDREQQMVLKKIYEGFVRGGIALDDAAQARLKEINSRVATLSQQFGAHLLAEANAFKEQFGIAVSDYPKEMASCADRARREALFKAYSSRGNHDDANDNKAVALEILRLKAEKAALLGYPSSAAYILDNKMAANPATVEHFLAEIMEASMAKARTEVADMQQVMDADIAAGLLPAGSVIEPWDWFYYAEKVRKARYALDEDLTRPYFACDSVQKGAFEAAHRLYGLNFERLEDVPVYHPDVTAWKVTDADGSLVGIFLSDFYSRDTKRGGAWMNNIRDQYLDADGEDVRPVIVNVCNFTPPTADTPSLLTIDEVQTLFHEFGHALHGLLSKCRYKTVSGTSVTRDFVETFSQFNENWAFEPQLLQVYAHHYQTGEVIPDSLVVKVKKAATFNQGFMTGELCAASILDIKWHMLTPDQLKDIDIRAFEDKCCREMGLIGQIIPRYRTTYFNHIFNSGYSAGYYGYLWSEVLDKDAFDYFVQHGTWNTEVARRFRETFLEKGGSEEPMVLYRSFKGGDPAPDAMLRARGLK